MGRPEMHIVVFFLGEGGPFVGGRIEDGYSTVPESAYRQIGKGGFDVDTGFGMEMIFFSQGA